MIKMIKCTALLIAVVLCIVAASVLFTPPASAASGSCWKVDCNICCRTPGGGTICTQRACV